MSLVTILSQSTLNGYENRHIGADNASIQTGSFEGRRMVSVRANACKVVTVYTLIVIGSSYLGSYCFGDQDSNISGLTSRTYEAVNTALVATLLTLQYTRPHGKLKNLFESGKICSYEFFAALMAAQMVTYSFFFVMSSSTNDPLSAGIYGASLATVLASFANCYKEQRNEAEIDLLDDYHCIEDVPSNTVISRPEVQSKDSILEGMNGKICKIAKGSIPVLWGIGSASFAALCFSGQEGLMLRTYEIINVGLVVTLHSLQQARPNKPLRNPLEAGMMCSYEFYATVEAANMVAYSLIFVANASKVDPLSAAIYGGALTATLSSYGGVFRQHVSASEDEPLSNAIDSFFDYSTNDRHVSVAVNDGLSGHFIMTNDGREYTRLDSLRPVDD